MVKVIESKSDFKKYFKECCKAKVPCVTIHFNESSANIRCDYDSVEIDPPDETIDGLISDQKVLWDKYLKYFIPGNGISCYGRYTSGKYKIEIAYELAKKIAKIMYKYAQVPYLEVETYEGLPVAKVISKNARTWVVICPFCGRHHNHGIGEGARESHCQKKNEPRNYYIKQ